MKPDETKQVSNLKTVGIILPTQLRVYFLECLTVSSPNKIKINTMNNIILKIVLGFSVLLIASCVQETTKEKTHVKSNEIQRTATEKVHRIEEAVCTGSEAECLAKKATNRTQETSEAIKDKTTELKDKMDN